MPVVISRWVQNLDFKTTMEPTDESTSPTAKKPIDHIRVLFVALHFDTHVTAHMILTYDS